MNIECFPVKMKEEEALRIAEGGKNPIVRALFGRRKINLRVMYLESRYITYEMTYKDNIIVRSYQEEKRRGQAEDPCDGGGYHVQCILCGG